MRKSLIGLAVTTAMLSACGGGGSSSDADSGDVSGLEMPQTMSVVAPSEESPAAGLKMNFRGVARALYDQAATDYSQDPTRTHVYDPSVEPLESVNMILCLMDQTAASDMVNQGAYAALVNEAKCEQGSDPSADTGQSSAGTVATYNRWIIESTRDDNSSPQHVQIWIPQQGGGGEGPKENIMVEVTVNEGVSDDKPFGDFELTFKGADENGNELMKGTLKTVDTLAGQANFIFYETGTRTENMGMVSANVTHTAAANVHFLSSTGAQGVANTFSHMIAANPGDSSQTFEQSAAYQVAFNPTHLLRNGTTTEPDWGGDPFANAETVTQSEACTSRTDFKTNVWRYNLYYSDNAPTGHTAGERVELNSGFPFTATVDGEEVWGFVGYWGLGVPNGVDVSGITQVTRKDFGSDTDGQTYDVVSAPGKLIKSTRSTLALSELAGVQFDYWDSGNSYVVEYDGSNWVKKHQWDETHQSYVDGFVEANISLSPGQWLGMWSQTLGGNVNYVQGDTTVTFYKQEFVNNSTAIDGLFGANNVVTFKCYNNCLKPNVTADDINNNQAFYNASSDVNEPAVLYSFDKATLKLFFDANDNDVIDAGEEVKWPTDGTVTNGQFSWGINAGEFIRSDATLNNVWEMFSQDVTYRWETGPNNWNRTFAVKDSNTGDFVAFDPPLHITYQFSAATDDANAGMSDDGSAYDGQTFLLEYGGTGNLWGLPGNNEGNRWEPAIALKDGTLLGADQEYVVKGMEKEQRMNEIDVSACSALNVDTVEANFPLPDETDVGTVTIAWAGKPNVTAAPAVVEGEVQ